MLFATQKIVGGVSKLAEVTPGGESIAQTMTKIVVAGNSALQASGAHQLTHPIMASKFDGLSITVLPGMMVKLRLA